MEGEEAKWTCGEAFEPETIEKFAVNGLGESGSGAGRLRMGFEELRGLMSARAGDCTPARRKD
jgi:hypothetical protein